MAKKKGDKKKKNKKNPYEGNPRFSELAKTIILTKTEAAKRKIVVKKELSDAVTKETQHYDTLSDKELKLKSDCIIILEKVIKEAEIVNDMFQVHFKTWLVERYRLLLEHETELQKAKLGYTDTDNRLELESNLNRLEGFAAQKDTLFEKLKRKENDVRAEQKASHQEMKTEDEQFLKELVQIETDLKESMKEAAEQQKALLHSQDSWIRAIITETTRINLNYVAFEAKAQALLKEYPPLKNAVLHLEKKYEVVAPAFLDLLSAVGRRKDIISNCKRKLREEVVEEDCLKKLDHEYSGLQMVAAKLHGRIRGYTEYQDKLNAKYQTLSNKMEEYANDSIYQTYEKMSQKLIAAKRFVAEDLTEVLSRLDRYQVHQDNLISPLLMLLDTPRIMERHRQHEKKMMSKSQRAAERYLRDENYAIGSLGMLNVKFF